MTIKFIIISLLIVLAVLTDLKCSKIFNVYVFPVIFAGVIINTCFLKIDGFLFSIKGMLGPVFLLGVFFCAGLLGAGDIKLFSAIGAMMGLEFVLYAMAFTFVLAGIIAFVTLIKSSEFINTFKAFFIEMKVCFLTKNVLKLKKGDRKVIRMSPSIAAGTVIMMLIYFFTI